MGLFKGKDDTRHQVLQAAERRANDDGDTAKARRLRDRADELASKGDVSKQTRWGLWR